jgi:hypothetical protein
MLVKPLLARQALRNRPVVCREREPIGARRGLTNSTVPPFLDAPGATQAGEASPAWSVVQGRSRKSLVPRLRS